MTRYEIQAQGQDGRWDAEYCGQDHTTFESRKDAEAAIEGLRQTEAFRGSQMRVVEVE